MSRPKYRKAAINKTFISPAVVVAIPSFRARKIPSGARINKSTGKHGQYFCDEYSLRIGKLLRLFGKALEVLQSSLEDAQQPPLDTLASIAKLLSRLTSTEQSR